MHAVLHLDVCKLQSIVCWTINTYIVVHVAWTNSHHSVADSESDVQNFSVYIPQIKKKKAMFTTNHPYWNSFAPISFFHMYAPHTYQYACSLSYTHTHAHTHTWHWKHYTVPAVHVRTLRTLVHVGTFIYMSSTISLLLHGLWKLKGIYLYAFCLPTDTNLNLRITLSVFHY